MCNENLISRQRYSTRKPFWYFLITVTSVALCDFYFESVLFQSSISKNMEGSILFHMDTRVVIHRVVQIRYTYCTSAVLTCIYHSQVFWWKLCHSFIFKFASKKFSCRQIFLSKDYIVCFLSNEICNIYSTQVLWKVTLPCSRHRSPKAPNMKQCTVWWTCKCN